MTDIDKVAYNRLLVPILDSRGISATRFPASGVFVDDPSPNPEFIINYLIRIILDISDFLTYDECGFLVTAVASAHFYQLVQPAPNSFTDRSEQTMELIRQLINLYNLKAEGVNGASQIIFPELGQHDKARPLMFVSKMWKGA